MASNELHDTARALVAAGKGILAADESTARSRSASTRSASIDRGEPPRLPRDAVHDAGARRVHQRRHPLRRDHPPGAERRRPVRRAARDAGHHARDQGRHRAQAAGARARARPSPRGSTACASGCEEYARLGARFAKWRAVITIGDGIPSRAAWGQRPRAGALRGALPGGGARPDRRARGAHGRRAHDRALLRGHRADAAARVFDELLRPAASTSKRMLLKPNMVVSGKDCSEQAPASQEVAEQHDPLPPRAVPAAVPGIVFLSGGQSDEQATAHLERDEPARPAAVGAVVLLRPGAAGAGAEGVGRTATTSRPGSRSSRCGRA